MACAFAWAAYSSACAQAWTACALMAASLLMQHACTFLASTFAQGNISGLLGDDCCEQGHSDNCCEWDLSDLEDTLACLEEV